MPSISRAGTIPSVIHSTLSKSSSSKKERVVGFLKDPVSAVSRPLNTAESWAAYDFEMHARKCAYCQDPFEVHRCNEQLCERGHHLAQKVARYIYQRGDGETYSTAEEDDKLVRVEIPEQYQQARGLLRAIEHSLRHRSQTPFVAMDRMYYVAARTPQRARSVKVEQAKSNPRPRSGETIDWPRAVGQPSKVLAEMSANRFKRGSLHERDLAAQRRSAKRFTVEVGKPSSKEEVEIRCPSFLDMRGFRGDFDFSPVGDTTTTNPFREDETHLEVDQPPEIEAQLSIDQLKEIATPNPLIDFDENNSSLASSSSGSGIYQPDEDRPWDPLQSFSGADNKFSVASSNEGSIFSIASLASSATDLSKASGYSTTQIATATRELQLILRDDEVLQPLYKTAIEGDIGPDRFVNNFRRLLKLYAENLKEEARDRIDFLAARLVAIKARHLAESILEKFWNSAGAPTLAPLDSKSKAIFAKEDSSDDEGEDNVEDNIFQDLVIARDFLVESNAFDNLRSRFREFVHSPKASTKKPTAKGKERASDQEDDSYSGKTISDSAVAAFSDCLGQDEPGDLTVRRFAKAFAHDPELHKLHRAAIAELGKELFVTKYSRTLRLYFKDLGEEAEHETDRAIIQEFRKRSNIKTIVNATINNITITETLNHIEANERALSQNDSSSLTSWLAEQQQRDHNHTELCNSPDSEHIGRAGESQGENKYQETVQLLNNEFLQQGVAFRKLALNIRLLSLPTSLREIVETVPKSLTKLSSVRNTSVINKLKGFAEDRIVLEWDWWPMGPRMPNPQPGTRRLEWKYCEQPLYRIVSEAHANIIQESLDKMPDHPPRCHCRHCNSEVQESAIATLSCGLPNDMQQKIEASRACGTARAQAKELNVKLFSPKDWRISWNSLSLAMPGNFQVISSLRKKAPGNSSARSKSSKASARYTPGSSSTPDSATPSAGGGRQNAASVPSGSSNNVPPQIRGQTPKNPPQSVPVTSAWILFGIQGSRWSLELEQITVSGLINDPTFFRELKARYKRHRGWLRMLLSPFRFQFCRFVKFEKFDADRVISQGDDLPDYHGFEHDYDYAPRPGKNPLISPKTFAICLKACDPQSCIWSRLSPWHDCIRLPYRSDRVRCIPKKKSRFDVDSDDVGILAWGLEADYALSFAFLAVYHLVPLLAALGFWVYWLATHPGDWQNSSVPILTVLALFAAFWMPFGKQF